MNALTKLSTKFRQYAAQSLNTTRTVTHDAKAAPYVSGSLRVGGSGSNAYLGDWLTNASGNKLSTGARSGSVWVPGTQINWDTVTGDILSCPACMACVSWVWKNRPQAPVIVETRTKDEWQRPQPVNPIETFMRRPNPYYDGDTLQNMAYLSLQANGNAYIVAERTNGKDITAWYWWPHNMVEIPPDNRSAIEYFRLRDFLGRYIDVPASDVWHLKWGLDPEDWRFGMAPAASLKRDIYTLQKAINYRANILRNFGAVGTIISQKDANSPIAFEPETIKDLWRDKTRGDNVGDVLALEASVDVHFPGVSPQNMALETMEDRPEANICAVFGLPAQVVGMHVGRLSKTYANYAEARESAWEEGVMPINNLFGTQVSFRSEGEMFFDATTGTRTQFTMDTRLSFDYSEVRPLQPDLDKLNTRELAVFEADAQTYGDFCKNTKRPEPKPELRDLFYSQMKQMFNPAPVTDTVTGDMPPSDNAPKALTGERFDWAERIVEEIKARERLREMAGRNGH